MLLVLRRAPECAQPPDISPGELHTLAFAPYKGGRCSAAPWPAQATGVARPGGKHGDTDHFPDGRPDRASARSSATALAGMCSP